MAGDDGQSRADGKSDLPSGDVAQGETLHGKDKDDDEPAGGS